MDNIGTPIAEATKGTIRGIILGIDDIEQL